MGIIGTTLRRLLRVRSRPGLLGVAAIAPLLMAQCAPSCAPSAAVAGAPVYGNGSYVVNQNFPESTSAFRRLSSG